MRSILLILILFIIFISCSTHNKGVLEEYYKRPQKVIFQKVTAPYSEVRYPVRFQEEVLRIWIAPHIVNDHLIEGHYIYTTVTRAHWYIEPKEPPKK